MADCQKCIVGQLYGGYEEGITELGIWDEDSKYGFEVPEWGPGEWKKYEELTQAWREILRERS
jgi:hypothetical protein